MVLSQCGRRSGSPLFRTVLYVLAGWLCLNPCAAAQSREAKPAAVPENPQKLSFNGTIQPILSENCYACHGPDPGARKAGLRLDGGEFAFAPHEKFGPAILQGNPDKSPLVRRIESSHPKERM